MTNPVYSLALFHRLQATRRTDTRYTAPDIKLAMALETAQANHGKLLWTAETIAPIHATSLDKFGVDHLILYSPDNRHALAGRIAAIGEPYEPGSTVVDGYEPVGAFEQQATAAWVALDNVTDLGEFDPDGYVTMPLTRATRPRSLDGVIRDGHVRNIIIQPGRKRP